MGKLSFLAPGKLVASVIGSKGLLATARVSLNLGSSSLLFAAFAEILRTLKRRMQETKDNLMNFWNNWNK